MALADLGDLLGADEHALDLGGLVGAAHPALDAHVGASARACSRQRRGEVAEREPDPGMLRVERGDDDFADVAGRHGIAGAGPHDFHDQVLVDDHAVARRRLERDHAEVGGAERLIGIDAARLHFVLQRFRKRRAGYQRALDRGNVAPGACGGVEQDLQEIRRAAIADRAIGLDQLELLLGIAGAGRNHRAAQRPRRGVENEAAGRQMVAEGIEHDVAGPEARRKQRPRAAPGVGMDGLGLENRPRRGKQPPERSQGPGHEPAERRRGLVQGREFRLAQHRQARQRGAAGHGSGIDALQPLGIGRRGQRLAQHVRKPGKQLRLAIGRLARLERIVMICHDEFPRLGSIARRL